MNSMSILKQCLAEVIVEPPQQKLQPNKLIKECVLEVLKSNLTEQGYDPQSQAGPNAECENPYPRWNNKMRQMEEEHPHGREAQMAGATPFVNDISEMNNNSSTEIKWKCPHCHNPTMIQIEVESPSDYIACSDCEHCGKEINDPKLDAKVYDAVINHYADRADYLKDMHTNEACMAAKDNGIPARWQDDKSQNVGTWGEIEHDHKSDKALPPKDDFPSRWK